MIVELKDLKKGDEILVAKGGRLLYLKVVVSPHLSIKRPTGWRGQPNYVAVKCSTRANVTTTTNLYAGRTSISTSTEYICTPFEHNLFKSFDLNYASIWLIKEASL